MTTVIWIRYQQFAGCKINGTVAVAPPTTKKHMDRAYYLTALMEAPFYGAVQSYDGAGMSAGPLHNIAVYPRSLTQGSLFSLLQALEYAETKSPHLYELWTAYRKHNWFVGKDGKLRNIKTGDLISGKDILDVFTPPAGRVPKTGAQWETAKRWAWLHHLLFADSATFEAQKDFAIRWLISTHKDVESQFYKGRNPLTLLADSSDLSLEEDLALCVYHCYSVNGPAPAKTELLTAISKAKKGDFAKVLLNELGTNTFGNWENRYVRTRNAALKSGLWPQDFFTGKSAIFPVRLGLNSVVGT
jgi:hypothetical protein